MHRKAKKLSTKFKRSVRAISPVIATLLMIAIAVVASLVAYAWVMGYLSGTTETAGKSIDIPSYSRSTGQWLVVYVQNVGQGQVQLKYDGAVFVNDVLHTITSSQPDKNPTNGLITIPKGVTAELTVDYWYTGQKISIKVYTVEGTFMETTGKESEVPSTATPPPRYIISVLYGSGGSINPSGPSVYVDQGKPQTFYILPYSGFHVANVVVDGDSIGPVLSHTFPNVVSDHSISATFAPDPQNTHTIAAAAGPNGAINPSGQISVPNGGSQSFTFQPDSGYYLSSITVDSTTISPPPSSYGFTNVVAGHTIIAIFAPFSPTPIPSASPTTTSTPTPTTTTTPTDTPTLTSSPTPTSTTTPTSEPTATPTATPTPTPTPTPAPLHHFTITGYPSVVTEGQPFGGVVVAAYDASNSIIAGYTGQVYFTWTAVTGDGSALLPYTTSSRYQFDSGDAGIHIFAGFSFDSTGIKTITVRDGTISATTSEITVISTGSLHYSTSMTPLSSISSASVSYSYTIRRESSRNLGWVNIQVPAGFTAVSVASVTAPTGKTWVSNGVSSNMITIHAQDAASELTSGQSVTVVFLATAPAVVGTYGPLVSTAYQTYTGTGSPGQLDGSDPSISVYATGVLDHFTITGSYPTLVNAGQNFGNIIVTAYDGGNNILTSYTGQVYFTSTDPAATLPFITTSKYAFTSSDRGAHTFAGFVLGTVGSQRITVTDGTTSATTNSITVSPGSLHHFTITGAPSSTTSGTSFGGITVTAYDVYNNLATNYRGQVYFTSTDTSAALPYTTGSRYTFTSGDNGIHTFTGFTLRTVGSRTITVTDGSISATTPSITVTASLHHFTITGYPTAVTVSQAFGGVVVTAYDASNNVLTGYNGQVYFTWTDVSGGGSAVLPYTSGSRYTFVSGDVGVHIFSGFEFSATGSKTITATNGTASTQATTSTITVIGTSALHYSTSMTPISSLPSTSISYTYTIAKVSAGYRLGNVNIQIPAGFTDISVTSVTSSNGQTWDKLLNGNVITVNAQNDAGELTTSGQTITVVFSATAPSITGTYGPLVSTVYEDYRGSISGSPGQLDGSDPSISVYLPDTPLIQTGFDGTPWDAYWQAGGNPPFYAAVGEGVGGTTAAKSDRFGSNSGAFTSDDMYTLDASLIHITFSYKVQNTNDPTDLRLAYSFQTAQPPDLGSYPNPTFVYIDTIGRPAEDNVWYTVTITIAKTATPGVIVDDRAFAANFYFRFESNLSTNPLTGMDELVWIDNIAITKSP